MIEKDITIVSRSYKIIGDQDYPTQAIVSS
jgi:hypothetical protein